MRDARAAKPGSSPDPTFPPKSKGSSCHLNITTENNCSQSHKGKWTVEHNDVPTDMKRMLARQADQKNDNLIVHIKLNKREINDRSLERTA